MSHINQDKHWVERQASYYSNLLKKYIYPSIANHQLSQLPLFLQALPIEHFWTIGRNQISTIQGHCLKKGGKLDKKGEQEHQTFLEKELCAGGTLTCNESLEGRELSCCKQSCWHYKKAKYNPSHIPQTKA